MKPPLQRWMLAITAFLVVACGDRLSTEPQVASPGAPALSSSSARNVVGVLKRTEPLDKRILASKVIGPRGGHIEIGRAGLRIEFAPGAVSVPTRISVTALRGRSVAYRFEPHGIQFQAPVIIRQSLRHTVAWKNPALAAQLQGSYFERLLVDPTESYAESLERRAARLRETGRMLEFSIEHFSGYMISVGLGRVEVEIDVNIDITNR